MPAGTDRPAVRRRFHPVTPAIVLLCAAVAGSGAFALGLAPVAAFWWALVGLVSGYAISGSV